ncbi:MAG: DUF6602 domain-containing protein [Cyanobacteria bacterium J06632_3]
MTTALREKRMKFSHSSNKGTSLESVFRQFLASYLPRTKAIGHGEIVDSFGARSPQVDVVITFDHHPYTFSETEPGLFFIEGVAAVGEVKSQLTSDELRKTIAHSKKVKALKRYISKGSALRIPKGFDARFMLFPPYFLFAYESQISLPKILKILQEEQHNVDDANALAGTRFVDGVFVLNRGFTIDFIPGSMIKGVQASKEIDRGWLHFEPDSLRPLLDWLYTTIYEMDYADPYFWQYTGLQKSK